MIDKIGVFLTFGLGITTLLRFFSTGNKIKEEERVKK